MGSGRDRDNSVAGHPTDAYSLICCGFLHTPLSIAKRKLWGWGLRSALMYGFIDVPLEDRLTLCPLSRITVVGLPGTSDSPAMDSWPGIQSQQASPPAEWASSPVIRQLVTSVTSVLPVDTSYHTSHEFSSQPGKPPAPAPIPGTFFPALWKRASREDDFWSEPTRFLNAVRQKCIVCLQ